MIKSSPEQAHSVQPEELGGEGVTAIADDGALSSAVLWRGAARWRLNAVFREKLWSA